MREGKLREILEECISAVMDGRRTIDDCLFLYPDAAAELEPLLRTAIEVNDAYQAETPSWHAQERIRNRVIAAAQARKRGRTLVSGINLDGRGWAARHWTGLGAAMAASVVALAVLSVTILGGGGDGSDPFVNNDLPVTVEPVVAALQDEVDELEQLLRTTGKVDVDQIIKVSASLDKVRERYPDFAAFSTADDPTKEAAKESLARVDEILTPVVEDEPTATNLDGARVLLGNVSIVDESWGEPDPATPEPVDSPEPSETPAPEPTDVPSETEAPAPTKVPEPTQKPAPEATPVATPGNSRSPQ